MNRYMPKPIGINHSSIKADADECAAVIFNDLRIGPGRRSGRFVKHLIWKYGGNLWFFTPEDFYIPHAGTLPDGMQMSRKFPGVSITTEQGDNYILISQELTDKEQPAVLFHEFIHRLQYSPAYEFLNKAEYACYPRPYFLELVARAAEKLFLRAGGTGVCKPGDLE